MQKIIGITIGPILETMEDSKKISEIANASLFFSRIMYDFLSDVSDKGYEIITPYFDKEEARSLLPDRAILRGKESENSLEEIEKIYKSILEKYHLQGIKEYLNFNIVETEEVKISEIFKNLDGIELIKNFPIQYKASDIKKWIQEYLYKFNPKKLDSTYSVDFQKYRAIICLDLDNMGKFSQKNISEIQDISKKIHEYIHELDKFIESKKEKNSPEGMILYSAGDDLLAILNPKYVFEFIQTACESLNRIFKDLSNPDLSVSFGIFICYEKYPIREAIGKAQQLLFGKAKNQKNAAAILIEKHSGQSCEMLLEKLILKEPAGNSFHKNDIYFQKLRNLIEDVFSNVDRNKEKNELLNTIIQKLYLHSFVLKEIIHFPERISYYLKEMFDKENNILEELKALLHYMGEDMKRDKDKKLDKDFDIEFNIKMEKVITFFKILKFYTDREGGR